MHFGSTHGTVGGPNIEIKGLANIDSYESLEIVDAQNALNVAEGFLCNVFRLRGIAVNDADYMLRLRIVKVPSF
ncbi:MAG: hypothetical protein QME58_10870 [Bacteroidota bacterium]|nr:hypothetical protein [Bacteroidota bacterium]